MKNTLFIIDAYNLIYRMFYAIPEITTRSGQPVNTIFGVAKFLKWLAEENPNAHIIVAADVGKSFRADIFSEYKWTRERMPDNLRSQIDGVFALFRSAKIQVLSQEWYEADDIIGSLASEYKNDDCQIVIISSDKDLCQFVVDDHVHIYDAMKRKFLKEKDVLEKFGVPATQVCDYLAIVWDSSDNIPGIAGFWPKKAEDLLGKYGSLEGIYEHLEDLTPKMQWVLIEQKENAFLSQKLATIVTDLKVDTDLATESTLSVHMSESAVIDFLKLYEFKSLIPSDHREVQKNLEIPESQNIEDRDILQKILESFRHSEGKKVYLSVQENGKVSMSSDKKVYSLNLLSLDVSLLLLEFIERDDITIVGYDLKEDIKSLLRIKKSLQWAEGQVSLF